MKSRERILAAVNHQPVDRVPTDIWATPEVWEKLKSRYGSEGNARRELHIDGIMDLRPPYIGPPFRTGCPSDAGEDFKVLYGIWGAGLHWMANDSGRYLEQTNYPLSHIEKAEQLSGVIWPDPDWFDYAAMLEEAKRLQSDHVIMSGYMSPIYIHNLVRGMEMSLMDPLAEPELTHLLLERICDFLFEYHRRIFETCDGLVDISQVTDDLGSQSGPMISLEMYRDFYAPHHRRFMKLCRDFGIKVFHHDDGSMRAFLPDLIDSGIDILNPVQRTCPGMELEGLKNDFGRSICFHGGIENQRILPFGTPDEVRAEVRHCIDTLGKDGTGYILAPCHNLQSITPVENIIAMYEEAWTYGRY
jgi:uroporphyrinogen decarboxylase